MSNAEGAQRRHVIHTWSTIYAHDPTILNKVLSEAWLKAAEYTPTWIWALVDLPETNAANYMENKHFVGIIQQVRDFFHVLIKVHKCDPEMVKTQSFRLGARHRHYMNEGRDMAYWHPFAQQLPPFIVKAYMSVIKEDGRGLKRLLRIRVGNDKSQEEILVDSWRAFMSIVVENMRKGYEGCATDKTPMRLSITNSIISMASFRSAGMRSRANSSYMDPGSQLSPTACRAGLSQASCPEGLSSDVPSSSSQQQLSPSPNMHYRSRSIFRARPTSEMSNYRRLSSPNRPFLTINDALYDKNGQRRSLTLLPGGLQL